MASKSEAATPTGTRTPITDALQSKIARQHSEATTECRRYIRPQALKSVHVGIRDPESPLRKSVTIWPIELPRNSVAGQLREMNKKWEVIAQKQDSLRAQPVTPDWYSIPQAAKYANVDERTIRAWLTCKDEKGEPMLPGAKKFGRKICIPTADLDRWRRATPRAKMKRFPKKGRQKTLSN